MTRLIKKFSDGSILEYDSGSFDDWCVYLTRPNQSKYAPKDIQYFTFFKNLSKKYSAQQIYDDFISIYDITNNKISQDVLSHIESISSKYENDSPLMVIQFTVVYAGMVAEENKAYTKLGKRVKRLGMYQCLLDGMTPQEAANFSKGKRWREISKICEGYGF